MDTNYSEQVKVAVMSAVNEALNAVEATENGTISVSARLYNNREAGLHAHARATVTHKTYGVGNKRVAI